MDSFLDSVKNIGVGAFKLTGNAVSGTAGLAAGAISETAKVTANVVSETAKVTANVVSGTANFTANVVSGTAKATANVVGSSLQILNLKDMALEFAKNYLINYLLTEEPVNTKKEILEGNAIYATTQMLIYPFEKIRMILQNQIIIHKANFYSGGMDCFFKEMRTNGILNLWRGVFPMLGYQLFYFNLLDYRIKTIFQAYRDTHTDKPNNLRSVYEIFKTLYLFDIALLLGAHPIEVLATKIGCYPDRKPNYNMYKEYLLHNPIKYYQGITSAMIMLNLQYIMLVPYVDYAGRNYQDPLQFFFLLVGGILAVEYITYPFDLIKRRFITQNTNYADFKYKSNINAIYTIFKEEHITGFYKGAMYKFVNYSLRRSVFIYLLSYYNGLKKNKS